MPYPDDPPPDLDTPSNENEVSGWAAPSVQTHLSRDLNTIRDSCQVVPAAFIARRSRTPSGSESTRLAVQQRVDRARRSSLVAADIVDSVGFSRLDALPLPS